MADQDPFASIAEQDPFASIAETPAPSAKTGPKPFYQRLGPAGRFASSFLSGFGVPESVQEHPSEAAQGLKLAATHPGLELESLKEMYNSMTKAQQDLIDEAFTKQHMPGLANKAEGFALGIYSAIPVFGPAIVNAVRQYQRGDKAGAAGSATAIITQAYRPGEARVATEPRMGAPGQVGEILPPRTEGLRRTLQGLTGAGPEKTTEPIIEKFRESARKIEAKNREITEKAFRTAGERKATYEQKVREQAQDYRTQVQQTQEFNRAQEEAQGRKSAIEELNEVESANLGVDLATLESEVYKEANRRFNDVRKEVSNQTRPPDKLISTVKDTEKNVLQGIPENVKEFRRILGLEGETPDLKDLRQDVMTGQGMTGRYDELPPQHKGLVDDIVAKWGGQIEPNTPVTWDLLQSLKSRIDRRLRSGRAMNGDLKRGLFGVRDAIVDEMGGMIGDRMAGRGGAAPAQAPAPKPSGAYSVMNDPAGQVFPGDAPLYHGTPARNVPSILQNGLEARPLPESGGKYPVAMLARTPEYAKGLTDTHMGTDPSDRAVIVTKVGVQGKFMPGLHQDAVFSDGVSPSQIDRVEYYHAGENTPYRVQQVGAAAPGPAPPTLLDDWLSARSFYRQWREDFHTPAGPSGSGSPVAQAIDAVDPARIRRPLMGDAQARALETLRKYNQFGGNRVADRASRIIARQEEADRISPQKPKAIPAPPKEVTKPKAVEAQFKSVQPPTREDIIRAKERALRETAVSWGKLHTYDLGILAASVIGAILGRWEALFTDPAFVAIRKSFGRAVSRPAVRSWIAQPLPEEMQALERLPEALKEDARDGLQDFIRKERREGRPITLAPPVQAFLGITRKPKKPGEQLRDLGQLTGSNPNMPTGPEQ